MKVSRVGYVYATVVETETGERFALPDAAGDGTFDPMWPNRRPVDEALFHADPRDVFVQTWHELKDPAP